MSGSSIYELLEGIKAEFILEAEPRFLSGPVGGRTKQPRPPRYHRIHSGVVAAILCIVVGVTVYLGILTHGFGLLPTYHPSGNPAGRPANSDVTSDETEEPTVPVVEDDDETDESSEIQNSFADDRVLVLIKPPYSDKDYSVEDFSDVGCIELEEYDLSEDTEGRLYVLTLDVHSKENVLAVVEKLNEREDIFAAACDYVFRPESIPNLFPDFLDPIPEEVMDELTSVYFATYGEDPSVMAHYYGTYHDCVVLFSNGQLAAETEIEVAGYVIVNGSSFILTVYKDGHLYDIKEAYDLGLITQEDVGMIARVHEQYKEYKRHKRY